MWTKDELPFEVTHGDGRDRPLRDLAAEVLRAASRLLDGLATRLDWVPAAPMADPVLEFYADAGAPEGALYVNGELVGHLSGVQRL
jgi:hypothetical protein